MADATSSRYAQALIELAGEVDAKENLVERFASDLGRFGALATNPDTLLMETLSHPGFTIEERLNALDAVLQTLNLHPLVGNFLRVVLEKGRFRLLPGMIEAYTEQADALAGRVRAKVATARALDADMRAQVTRSLEAATGKTVIIEESVDATLIGGVVAEVEGRVFDASLRTRLLNLRQRLLSGSLDAVAEA
ncbi:MAG: ATP synthase F1 subunit delta [Alphaproteobacteria bacterium]|nr:ATP synthase F1 subunit delta [Alphaproteobacteria bacterium]